MALSRERESALAIIRAVSVFLPLELVAGVPSLEDDGILLKLCAPLRERSTGRSESLDFRNERLRGSESSDDSLREILAPFWVDVVV